MSHNQRKNYSIKFKLKILNEYNAGVKGSGWLALSKKYNIGTSILRGWHNKKPQLLLSINDPKIQIKSARRLPGGGRKLQFDEVERQVLEWVNDRNAQGLRVKDKYIQLKAQEVYNILKLSDNEHNSSLNDFKHSSGWCQRFKNRHNLVSRRQTTTKNIPENVDTIVSNFLKTIHSKIEEKRIKNCNIINFDQVPRYFQSEPKTTITSKGCKEVLMRKANSSHKRFTTTLAITLEGKFLKPHVLFSNLKNKPNVNKNCAVDVNRTGMFNDVILKEYIKEIILNRPQTRLLHEPVLLIMDSYGSHVKLNESKYLEKYNISVVLVPPNLTGLLQPLDVAINRSFQEYYITRYDEYIAEALNIPEMQTRQGNPKIPNYKTVSDWIVDYVVTKDSNFVANAFKFCGIVSKADFKIDGLHSSLQKILESNFDYDNWIEKNRDLIAENQIFFENEDDDDWFLPEDVSTSFFKCIHEIKEKESSFSTFITNYIPEIISFIKNASVTSEILDINDEELIRRGENSSSYAEIYAISRKEKWCITVVELDSNWVQIDSFIYEIHDPKKSILLARNDKYFVLKLKE